MFETRNWLVETITALFYWCIQLNSNGMCGCCCMRLLHTHKSLSLIKLGSSSWKNVNVDIIEQSPRAMLRFHQWYLCYRLLGYGRIVNENIEWMCPHRSKKRYDLKWACIFKTQQKSTHKHTHHYSILIFLISTEFWWKKNKHRFRFVSILDSNQSKYKHGIIENENVERHMKWNVA